MANTKGFRENYHYTQKQLSEEFGIPLATIQNWEARNCAPDYIIRLLYMHQIHIEKISKYRKCIKDNIAWGNRLYDIPDDLI